MVSLVTARIASSESYRSHSLAKSLVFAPALVAALLTDSGEAETFQVSNPLIMQRADPFIHKHTDGYYYFTATVPAYNLLELRRATTIQGLSAATPTTIWRAHASGAMAAHIWAPELHHIEGSWYVYFAAGSSSNVWDIRVYVLSNTAENPMSGTWIERGQLLTNGPKANGAYFALDATTFEHDQTRYLVWAEADPSITANTVLYIAKMSNPWTLSARGVRISAPEYTWEKQGYAVNEGPAVLRKNGKIFISYSASATDANYCVGLLTASDTSNLLAASSWTKASSPVFRSANGVYGPGHNQFTTSPDGTIDLLVYHGRDYQKIVGEALDDPNRATRVQPLNWKSDGTPDFGAPRADGSITIEVTAPEGGAAGASSVNTGGRSSATGTGGSGGVSGRGGSGSTSTFALGGSAANSRSTGLGGTRASGMTSGSRTSLGGNASTDSVGTSSGGTTSKSGSVAASGGVVPSGSTAAGGTNVLSDATDPRAGGGRGASSASAGRSDGAPIASTPSPMTSGSDASGMGCGCRAATLSPRPSTGSRLLIIAGVFALFRRRRPGARISKARRTETL